MALTKTQQKILEALADGFLIMEIDGSRYWRPWDDKLEGRKIFRKSTEKLVKLGLITESDLQSLGGRTVSILRITKAGKDYLKEQECADG